MGGAGQSCPCVDADRPETTHADAAAAAVTRRLGACDVHLIAVRGGRLVVGDEGGLRTAVVAGHGGGVAVAKAGLGLAVVAGDGGGVVVADEGCAVLPSPVTVAVLLSPSPAKAVLLSPVTVAVLSLPRWRWPSCCRR